MHVGIIVRLCLAALALSVATQSAQAQNTDNCSPIAGSSPYFGSIALQINTLAVPRNVPEGTILYTQNINQPGVGLALKCTFPNAERRDYFSVTNARSNTGYLAGFYGGKIFATGVPGIGIAWYGGNGNAVGVMNEVSPPFAGLSCAPISEGGDTGRCIAGSLKFPPGAALVLIKTGLTGTGTINGADLGKVQMGSTIGTSVQYFDAEITVTGTIQVVGVTCTTRKTPVDMGKQQMSSLEGIGSGPGSYTPTVNFQIELMGCPGFPGRFAVSDPSLTSMAGVSTGMTLPSGVGTWMPNTLGLRLDADTTVINADNGVLGLTAETGVATGVGVQVLKADGTPMPLSRSVTQDVVLDANTKSVIISLGARYLQTAPTMTGGKANAVATYTLSYQ